jgi:hypothetical protein
LDLTKHFDLAEAAMGPIYQREGVTQDQVIFMVLERVSGRRLTDAA